MYTKPGVFKFWPPPPGCANALVCYVFLQCAELREAVWGCNWVGAPIVEQRALIFMMAATKDFNLSAGGVIPVSRHTMMQVSNQTYSFLMFLMNLMDNWNIRKEWKHSRRSPRAAIPPTRAQPVWLVWPRFLYTKNGNLWLTSYVLKLHTHNRTQRTHSQRLYEYL